MQRNFVPLKPFLEKVGRYGLRRTYLPRSGYPGCYRANVIAKMANQLNILSNVEGLDRYVGAGDIFHFQELDRRWLAFMRQCTASDLVIIDNGDQSKLYVACLLRPLSRFRLVSVDIILRPPVGIKGRVLAWIKRLLLQQVDRFVLYFKNTDGYERHYAIDRRKVTYVPFKVNGLDEHVFPSAVPEGEYVLCAGRTLRDIDTFVAAMAEAGHPAMLLQQDNDVMLAHGTVQPRGTLPENVRLQIHADGQLRTFVQFIAEAKIVVIPRYSNDIGCTGISTYMVAMALGKAVILTRGPGAEDVLSDQAMLVEPENPKVLANAIGALWNDDALRRRLADAGRVYAMSCGGTSRLAGDILQASLVCIDAEKQPIFAEPQIRV